jgi:hypothetical protein
VPSLTAQIVEARWCWYITSPSLPPSILRPASGSSSKQAAQHVQRRPRHPRAATVKNHYRGIDHWPRLPVVGHRAPQRRIRQPGKHYMVCQVSVEVLYTVLDKNK